MGEGVIGEGLWADVRGSEEAAMCGARGSPPPPPLKSLLGSLCARVARLSE